MKETKTEEKETAQEKNAEEKSAVEKHYDGDCIEVEWIPFGVMSFEELEAAQDAKAAALKTKELAEQFKQLTLNIMSNQEIEDKAAAVKALADEFSDRVTLAMEQKEKWQPLTDKLITRVDELKQRPMKTEGGVKFPASDFAFVPESGKPSTWKLRLAEIRPGNVTVKQLGRAAAAFSAGGFRGKKVQIPSNKVAAVKGKIRAAYKKLGVKSGDIPDSVKEQSFTIWKEKDGDYRWLAIYSNNYRDDDSPPEIISKEAHLDFVRAVDEGEWPMPELWYWHVKGTKWGQTDFIAYDEDTGFSVAAGTIDRIDIAERVAQRKNLKVSHGMPPEEIRRGGDDSTILTRYRTKEISPLPGEEAANKITNFMTILKETEDMTIPEHKKQELEEMGFNTEELEAKLQSGKAQAGEEGREQKEVETKEPKQEQVPETPEQTTPEPQIPEPLTAEVITAAFTAAMQPVMERIETLEGQIKGLAEEVETKEDPLDLTPAASLASMFVSGVLGQSAARVDGRKTRHDAPKEATKAKGPQILNSGNLLADDVIGQLLDPEGAWVNDLPTGQPQ